jgi:hypothetical protein
MAEKRVFPKVILNPSDADFNLQLTEDLTVKTLGEGGFGYLVSFYTLFDLLDEDE